MGIPHLNGFVRYNVPLYKVNLKDFKSIVIDGNNIYSKLHRNHDICWKYGGEYPQFYRVVRNFLEVFVRAGLRVIVVMDGLTDTSKLNSSKESKLWSIRQLARRNGVDAPLLRCQVFIDVLLEMTEGYKVDIFVSDGDGDKDAAAIANQCNCPVLSDDSDFFMYDLRCGVIPFYSLNLQTGQCLLYTVELFLKSCAIRDSSQRSRFLIPAMFGNDYLKPTKYLDGIDRVVRDIANGQFWIGMLSSEVQANFEAACKQYSYPTLLSEYDFKCKIACRFLPRWVIDAYGKGCFHPFLLNAKRDGIYLLPIVVEDIRQDSAWVCCRYVRQRMYAIMEISPKSHVTEVLRKNSSIELDEDLISPIYLDRYVNLHSISRMTVGEREWLVIDILTNYHSLSTRLKKVFQKLDMKWKLPVAATNYWYRNAGGENMAHLAKSLLLGFLRCSSKVECRSLPKPSENIDIIHTFAKWQCVYHDAMALNCLAKECFTTTSPALLFSGSTVMSFAACDTTSLQCGSIHVPNLYYKLLELVTFEIRSASCRPRACVRTRYSRK